MSPLPILQKVDGIHLSDHIVGILDDEDVISVNVLVAFATLDGVLLLGPEPGGALYHLLERGGEIDAIIGIDAITTVNALRRLRDLALAFPGKIRIRAYESRSQTLFHPKLYIFGRVDDSGIVLIGSNNLTTGGLIKNTEIALRVDLHSSEISVWRQIFAEVAATDGAVHEVTEALLERVAAKRRREVRVATVVEPMATIIESEPTFTILGSRILLQTVPRAGDRLSQVGIAAEDMGEFFGLIPGEERLVQIRQVQPGISLGAVEERKLVRSDVNRNSRIEVSGVRGIPYPSDQYRPILIFHEVSEDFFRYMLLMPGNLGYSAVQAHLEALPKGLALPHQITKVERLLEIWPDYPI